MSFLPYPAPSSESSEASGALTWQELGPLCPPVVAFGIPSSLALSGLSTGKASTSVAWIGSGSSALGIVVSGYRSEDLGEHSSKE